MKALEKNRGKFDFILTILGVFIAWLVAGQFDLFETVVRFAETHEEYELDEILFLVLLAGVAGYIYAFRRHLERERYLKNLARKEKELSWLSKHDALTNLPNRRYLQQFLQDNPDESAAPLGIFSVDLNGFKQVNDLLGHDAGDRLLSEVANRLKTSAKVKQLFRMGGDEFLLISDLSDESELQRVAEELSALIVEPISIDGSMNQIGASIGVSVFPRDASTIEEAIHCADLAMFSAKKSPGVEIVFFQPAMIKMSKDRASLEADLRQAIANEEIYPHYQPLIDLQSGKIRGFEALARWMRPGHGVVPPTLFVNVAEEMGVISSLTDLMLRKACEDAKDWPEGIVVSVNLSPLLLSNPQVGLHILSVLSKTGLPPQRLEVEITEKALIQSPAHAEEILEQLQAVGVSVAIDDFGVGYSNLSQLSLLNFDRIKIDRSLVSGLEDDTKKQKLVKTILFLTDSLDIKSTAEGIESTSEFDLLTALGCSTGQGYLLGKPLDAAKTLDYLEEFGDDPKAFLAKVG